MSFDPKLALTQTEAVEYMLRAESDGGAMLAFDVGLGKTRTGLMFAKAYGTRCLLVVAPLQTLDDWELTAGIEYPGMPVSTISSSINGRDALAGFQWRKPGIYLVTHEYWERLAWTKQLLTKKRKTDPDKFRKVDSGAWSGSGFDLIYDECHRAANVESWTHQALRNLTPFSEGGPFKLGMSGTFMGDRFSGAYGSTKWVWAHRVDILPDNLFKWVDQWAETEYDHYAPRNQKVTGEKDPGAFVSALPCYIRVESDLPPAATHDVWVDLYPEQQRVYDELDDKMVAWINDNPLVAEYSITKRVRQRQTTLALPTLVFEVNEETGLEELADVRFDDDADSAKVDALFREIDGEGTLGKLLVDETAIILTDSQQFARLLTKRLNDRYGDDTAREWSGAVAREKGKQKRTLDRPYRKGIKKDFIDGKIRFVVGVQAAMGTGTNGLQHATHIVIFMSRSDRRIDNEQGIGRARRMGQTQTVHVISMLARNTLDEGQLSKQLAAAIKASKQMRAKKRKEEREARIERIRQAQQGINSQSGRLSSGPDR